MSITSCLVLFLLCISLHACNARHLGAVDKKLAKKIHFSFKNDEKMGSAAKVSALPKVKSSLSKKLGAIKRDGIAAETLSNVSSQKPKDSTRTNQKTPKVEAKTASSAVQADQSLVSTSWPVPHNKLREKDPGFNLDYSPPKTHPPSHN